jgi:hypothetical protein
VPLRAAVSIGLARQDQVFDDIAPNPKPSGSIVPTPDSGSAQKAADQGGDSGAARQLASDNGLESLRFTAGASLQVNGGVQLNPAAGFAVGASASGGLGLSLGVSAGASAGAGASFSAGASAGASAGFSGNASASASAGASAGFSAGAGFTAGASVSAGAATGAVFGSAASMGVPATLGAFAGLQTGRASVSTTAQLDPMRMVRSTAGSDVSTYSGASFALGGAGNNSTGAGLSSNVGATLSFRDRLTFDNDD